MENNAPIQQPEPRFRALSFSIPWNLALITMGSALCAVAINAIAIPHGLLTGGMSGVALLLFYITDSLTTGIWFFIFNLPVFVLGWVFVSRRFFLYSLYGMGVVTLFLEVMPWVFPIYDKWLAVFTCGALLGIGVGIALRSLGSTGGTDIIGVIAKQRFGLAIGKFKFLFDILIFSAGFAFLDMETMLYSCAMIFVTGSIIDYSLNVFTERKMALIISNAPDEILEVVLRKLDRGATLLYGRGAYSGQRKKIVMTMINNIQLKRLEEMVYSLDPGAFLIIGSNYNVLGRGFSSRKVY